jgi:hypothetical protein
MKPSRRGGAQDDQNARVRARLSEARRLAEDHYSTARYWREIGAANSMVDSAESDTHPGDLVLLDADPRIWNRKPQSLNGRQCAIPLDQTGVPHFRLCRVYYEPLAGNGAIDYGDDRQRMSRRRSCSQ